MIDVITAADYSDRQEDLLAMHRLRARVFKDRLEWEVTVEQGLERDQFDARKPDYLLCFSDEGQLVGTWRLLPTTGPYMLRDVFSQLLEGAPAPASPKIWEGSRFAVDRSVFEREGLGALARATGEVFCGLVEYCMANDIDEVLTVYDLRIARLLPRIGCHRAFWRSGVHRVGSTLAMAGRFPADAEMLASIREACGIEGSVIRQAPWLREPVGSLSAGTGRLDRAEQDAA